jgi:cyclophilin family peptidyl-prolyl cis-trans isomerase
MRGLLVAALAALLLVAGCGGGGDAETSDDGGGSSDTCEQVEPPAPREAPVLEAPSGTLDPETTYELVFDTSCGSFTVLLDQRLAPETTKSLVSLAEEGFYEDTVFHRIVPGFVIQGGDPTQTGTGGPGYTTTDPPPPSAQYTTGVVAMAKAMDEPPGSAGSQFFVVTADDAQLDPDYAIVGEVTEGLDTVDRIGVLGDEEQRPTQPVVIRGVTVQES